MCEKDITYRQYFSDKGYMLRLIVAIAIFTASLFINFYAGTYATESASNTVTDIILSNTRIYDLNAIFIYGTYIFWTFFTFLCLWKPQKMPFTLKSVALFIVIRSVFISMTHIAPMANHLILDSNSWISDFTFGGDLFFSGHTGTPFLMALIYWDNKYLRYIFITVSIIFGITVLLTHLHYAIDVFSAFFITYTIYHIAVKFFKKDLELFLEFNRQK